MERRDSQSLSTTSEFTYSSTQPQRLRLPKTDGNPSHLEAVANNTQACESIDRGADGALWELSRRQCSSACRGLLKRSFFRGLLPNNEPKEMSTQPEAKQPQFGVLLVSPTPHECTCMHAPSSLGNGEGTTFVICKLATQTYATCQR